MKTAVISDIHANLEALEAVCADLAAFEPDHIVCLGDLIGYGPDPEAVVTRVARSGMRCVQGNHEAALFSEKERRWLNFLARENNIATRELLSEASLAYCAGLPRSVSFDGSRFVHGFPPDSILTYLYKVSDADILKLAAGLPEDLFFVGHTHDLQLVVIDGATVVRKKLTVGRLRLDGDKKYLVNVGSVGHPRDGSGTAKYVIWERSTGMLEVRGVPYPAHLTAEKIIGRGFPSVYALCLRPAQQSG